MFNANGFISLLVLDVMMVGWPDVIFQGNVWSSTKWQVNANKTIFTQFCRATRVVILIFLKYFVLSQFSKIIRPETKSSKTLQKLLLYCNTGITFWGAVCGIKICQESPLKWFTNQPILVTKTVTWSWNTVIHYTSIRSIVKFQVFSLSDSS